MIKVMFAILYLQNSLLCFDCACYNKYVKKAFDYLDSTPAYICRDKDSKAFTESNLNALQILIDKYLKENNIK